MPPAESQAAHPVPAPPPFPIPSGPSGLQQDPSKRQAHLAVARAIKDDWRQMNVRLRAAPREIWDAEAARFRLQHQPLLMQVEAYFGSCMALRHPSEEDPLHPGPPISPPSDFPSRPPPPPSPAMAAFQKEVTALRTERAAVEANHAADSPQARAAALETWDTEHADRLAAHGRAAQDLQQRSLFSPPAAPNSTPNKP